MKYFIRIAAILCLWNTASLGVSRDSIQVGRFGQVAIYGNEKDPSEVVLFVSGDGGWNEGVVGMAKELASEGALVAGINITHYLRELEKSNEGCSYPAADFEALSQEIQQKYNIEKYITPILVGYSSGATLIYAILVQAPFNTFKGGISLGFCPDLPLSKPFCKGSGLTFEPLPKGKGYSFKPSSTLQVPWIALQGTIDQVCDPSSTAEFIKETKNAEIILLPKVGHGYSVERNWLPQFKEAYAQITHAEKNTAVEPTAPDVKDLPLVEIPAKGDTLNALAIIYSGDGGWGVTERGISKTLGENGVGTVGVSSLQYFWSTKTPDSAASDLARIMRHYMTAWNRDKFVLMGYSFGADVLPFMINRLPDDLKSKIKMVGLLGPSETAYFKIHVMDIVGSFSHKGAVPTLPELEKMRGMRIFCFHGTDDDEAICASLDTALVTSVPIEGGHRFKGRYSPVTDTILGALKKDVPGNE